jgi:hypothetical protein
MDYGEISLNLDLEGFDGLRGNGLNLDLGGFDGLGGNR